MPPARTKDRLLDAAGAVVMRDGAQALTLDAVAEEAEVFTPGAPTQAIIDFIEGAVTP